MARPRKNPDDPKWQNVGTSQQVPTACAGCDGSCKGSTQSYSDPWLVCYAAALTGLISRGGASMESMIKTARQYADEAVKALEAR